MKEAARSGRRREASIAIALGLLSCALYAGTLLFDFVSFDDQTVLLAHPNLYNETSLTSSLREIFIGYFPREEPLLLRDVTWAIDARIYGLKNPFGFHLGNVVLNALNTSLLFWFLLLTTRRLPFAAVTAGLFALLPVHVEPVSWVMGRKDLLSAFFMLLALLAQTYEFREGKRGRRHLFYTTTLVCSVLALFSKTSAVALFGVLALHQIFFRYLDHSAAPDAPLPWRALLPRCALRLAPHAACSIAVFVWYRGLLLDYGVLGWSAADGLHPEHLAVMAGFVPLIIAQYLQHLAWPFQLSAYYWWPHVEVPLSGLAVALGALIAIAGCVGVAWCVWRRRDLSFYPLAFLALVAPHLGFAYVGFWSADRYIYLASFCVVGLVTELVLAASSRGVWLRRSAVGVALAFATVSFTQTWRQQAVWRDSESLWSHEAHLDAPSLFALQALAKLYVKRAEAETHLPLRNEWAGKAEHVVERGIALEQSLGRRETRYKSAEQLHLARLHSLRGRLSTLRGAPIEEQLTHYERAYALAPERGSALLLSIRYYEAAGHGDAPTRTHFARRSLKVFMDAAAFSGQDARRMRRLRVLFNQHFDERRFPFLADEIRSARRHLSL